MDLTFYVGSNGAGKSFKLNQIFKTNENSLYVNEEGQPTFSLNKPKVKIDIKNKTYHFQNDLKRGNDHLNIESEQINEEFLPLLQNILELQSKNNLIKSTKSKGQEKFGNLLNIFTEFNFNNLEYICLDEPENFLDEDYIKEIARLILELSKIGFKVKVATHSVRILTECSASIEQICILDRTNEYTTSNEEIREIMKSTRDEIMKYTHKDHTLGKNILAKLNACDNPQFFQVIVSQTIENEEFYKCLFNKTIVLVEGASEIVALKTIKTRFENSTEFFSPHGKVYMPFFVKLLNLLGKEVIVLIDTDKQDYKLPWILTEYFKKEQEKNKLNLITHEPDFEDFYEIPWKEIVENIGIQPNERLNGEWKPIVAMIFFEDDSNQQRLYEKIQSNSVENVSKYTFV
ncbi:TOPRIM nucleotidyl transferase/hydrolase domain-containing protein [Bacillus thuringiensis]|uniref:TOPRIM nucleotidyl transferase/hydrolase domain-containing protein n=1 Tax=Bacillus thuringiensis TaxID=1428 RepID=UPI0011A0DDA5|nr:TOPRIM nucleotidyl transferase/hydrolase domain-containing protein [Bacillus thuringiensis]